MTKPIYKIDNTFREIKPCPKPVILSINIFNHFQILRTGAINGHNIAKEDPPQISTYGTFISVKRILLKYQQYTELRHTNKFPNTLQEILVPSTKSVNYYNKSLK